MAKEKLDLIAEKSHDQHEEQHEEQTHGHGDSDHGHDTHDKVTPTDHPLDAQIEEAESHDAEHGGEVAKEDVFPTLLGGLGNHRDISFFGYGKVELPVIIYDEKEGFNFYGSSHAMEEAGTFTMHHHHPPITRVSDHEPVTLDMSITSLLVFQWLAIFFVLLMFGIAGRKYRNAQKAPSGFQNLLETLIIYVRDKNYMFQVRSELHYSIFELFKKEGIEIPFPQRDLNIKGNSNSNIKKRVSVKKDYTK